MTEREYRVTWTIECSAYSAEDAVAFARETIEDPTSHATTYEALDIETGVTTTVDIGGDGD